MKRRGADPKEAQINKSTKPTSSMIFVLNDQHPRFFPLAGTKSVSGIGLAPNVYKASPILSLKIFFYNEIVIHPSNFLNEIKDIFGGIQIIAISAMFNIMNIWVEHCLKWRACTTFSALNFPVCFYNLLFKEKMKKSNYKMYLFKTCSYAIWTNLYYKVNKIHNNLFKCHIHNKIAFL